MRISASMRPQIYAQFKSGLTYKDIARNYGTSDKVIGSHINAYINSMDKVAMTTMIQNNIAAMTADKKEEDNTMSTIINNTISNTTSIVKTRLTPVGSSSNLSGTIGKQEYIKSGVCTNGQKWVRCSLFKNLTNQKTGEITREIYNLKLWGDAAEYFLQAGLKQGDLVEFSGVISQSNKSKYKDFDVNHVNGERGYGFRCECKRAIEAKNTNKVAC